MPDSVETDFRRALVKPSSNIVGFVLASVFLCTVLGKPICEVGTYYDTGTDNCDPCSHICENSEVQKTTAECETKCPGYGRRESPHGRKCPYLHYYDAVVSRCDSCEGLCIHLGSHERDHEEKCRRHCPEWPGNSTTTVSPQDSTMTNSQNKSLVTYNLPYSLVILLATCVVAVAAVGVLCVFLIRRKKCFCQRPSKPIPELLTGEGNPLTHPEDDHQGDGRCLTHSV
ncbi:uncharacterized protein LOC124259281 [Haliotis rubra]|uniref:uncharacterized protein LOC124259281 n=1 Tax=Haliotis rubra TaxID=36100 RepID=UPI001EE58F67|nr:uncharacterized protein LOC124259281 [Haliotis rubra]